jgi:hypothetical protein
MSTVLHYVINFSLGVLALFGVAELGVLLLATVDTGFDWPDEDA